MSLSITSLSKSDYAQMSRIKGSAREDELESAVPVSWRQAGLMVVNDKQDS